MFESGEKAARDHVWITKDEVKALAPAKAEVGFRYAMPAKVADRLIRYHLIDNTRGEPTLWKPDEVRGQRFTLVAGPAPGTQERVSVAPAESLAELKPGDSVLMDDGMIQLEVEERSDHEVHCRVIAGGRISDHKGISFAHVPLPISCLTDKDREDLIFGIHQGVDLVAVSFVRSQADIREVRTFLDAYGAQLPIIAKIERREALANLGSIVTLVDGIMVARGDLGLDVPLEEVPHIQKDLVRRARAANIPVIVATQMLESMVAHMRPTRAEISDVCTAILDGADAIMLSGETSVGRYPIKSVRTMGQIVEAVEAGPTSVPPLNHVPRTQRGVLSFAARDIGERLSARALVAFSVSGDTVRRLARLHTRLPLLAFTPKPEVRSQLAMSWGVETFLVDFVTSTDAMVRQVDNAILSIGRFKAGDTVVVVAGSPPGTSGSTNLIRVHRLGEDDHA